jgi:hypothetical protein
MTPFARSLIVGTALTIIPLSPACAGGSTNPQGSIILNGQVDLHTSISTLNTTVTNVKGGAGIASVAGGNAVDITTMNDTRVKNDQFTSSVDIFSDLGARVDNVSGSVSVSGQATCNAAQVSTDPSYTQVDSNQECRAIDPTSAVNVDAQNVGGDLSVTNLAAGNSFQEDTNAPYAPITNNQINASNTTANTTAHIMNVAGTVNVTSTSVGNTAQIVHYGTGN